MQLSNKYGGNPIPEINAWINDYLAWKILDEQERQEQKNINWEKKLTTLREEITKEVVIKFPFLEKFMEDEKIPCADLWNYEKSNLEGRMIIDDWWYYWFRYWVVDKSWNIKILPYSKIYTDFADSDRIVTPENKEFDGETKYLLEISDDPQTLNSKISIVDLDDRPKIKFELEFLKNKKRVREALKEKKEKRDNQILN